MSAVKVYHLAYTLSNGRAPVEIIQMRGKGKKAV
jgi:hypothetical protein